MSKISLEPNASGAGTFTLAAPNSNTNRTLNLPDEAGVVLTDTSDIETQVKTATNATGDAPVFACRAWVNFDGTGTPSIRASGNVSSVTRITTGRYTVNFATAMPDTNYSFVGICRRENDNTGNGILVTALLNDLKTTSAFNMTTVFSRDQLLLDSPEVNLHVFR